MFLQTRKDQYLLQLYKGAKFGSGRVAAIAA